MLEDEESEKENIEKEEEEQEEEKSETEEGKEVEEEKVEEEKEVGEGEAEDEEGKVEDEKEGEEEGEGDEEMKGESAPAGPKKCVFGLEENVAGLLAYLVIFVTGIIFLLLEKENKFVRFHAMQSIVIFLPAMIIVWILQWFPYITGFLIRIIGILMVIAWLVGMYKAYKGEYFKFPVAGDIAENMLKEMKI